MATIVSNRTVGDWIITTEIDLDTGVKTSFITNSTNGSMVVTPRSTADTIAFVNRVLGTPFPDIAGPAIAALNEQSTSLTSQYNAEKAIPKEESLPTDESKVAQNKSNDEAGAPSDKSNPDVKAFGNTETALPSATDGALVSNAGTTTQGKSGSSELTQGKYPTVRKNPLGYLASYTYQITLYMLTADAVNSFRAGGRRNISNLVIKSESNANSTSGGAYIILQSGGINNTSSVTRAPGFNLDYYIDNLQITNLVSPSESKSPTVTSVLSFNIIEPYGFSFLSKLKYASDELGKYSSTLNAEALTNASRQNFVLGVRFLGYDKYGNTVTGKETIDGRTLDPAGSGNGLYETFYDIMFKKVAFKIDGKTTNYSIEATSINADTLGVKNNIIPAPINIEATTVEEALTGKTGLITLVNNYWSELVKNNDTDIGFKFNVEYIGDLADLKGASIVLPEDVTKWKWPIKRDPNDVTGDKAIPNNTKRQIKFSNTPSMPITSAIEKIISQSTFLRDSLKVNYTNEIITDDQTDTEAEVKPDSNKIFRWFNITTNTKILGYSTKQKDWVYEITYVISPYETPVVISPYVKNLPKYYGPVKRYDYWFTGKNSEVINYEQQNNNSYFLVVLDPNENKNNTNGSANIPQRPTFQQNNDKTGKLGAGSEATGSITTNLYDPKAYAMAKITILGDPDFLVQDSLNYDVASKKFNQFYAPNGTTINPTGGQIFIEIDFKEAVDYEYGSGLMTINDNISFWQYSESVKKMVKGVSYQIKKIISNFKGGKFTQDLELVVNQFGPEYEAGYVDPKAREDNTERQKTQIGGERTATGSVTTAAGNSTSNNTGLKETQPVAASSPPPVQSAPLTPDESPIQTTDTLSEADAGRET